MTTMTMARPIRFIHRGEITQPGDVPTTRSLLDWLHTHHGHLQDATLLRLFHELQHEGSWQIEVSEHPETTTLQAIRVLHHPHRVSIPE